MLIKRAGFTLIELLVALAVLATLVGIAGPSFRQLLIDTRLDAGVSKLVGSVNLARSTAITQNQTVSVVRSSDDWAEGWCIALGEPGDCSGDVIRQVEGVDLELAFGSVVDGELGLGSEVEANSVISFTNEGFLPRDDDGGLADELVFQLCDAAATAGYQIRIGNTGRPVWSSVDCDGE